MINMINAECARQNTENTILIRTGIDWVMESLDKAIREETCKSISYEMYYRLPELSEIQKIRVQAKLKKKRIFL